MDELAYPVESLTDNWQILWMNTDNVDKLADPVDEQADLDELADLVDEPADPADELADSTAELVFIDLVGMGVVFTLFWWLTWYLNLWAECMHLFNNLTDLDNDVATIQIPDRLKCRP